MAKCLSTNSSTVFAVIIFGLLLLSVGLLVFVLKGQIQHENSQASTASSRVSPHSSSTKSPSASTTDSNELFDDISYTTESESDVVVSPWEDFRLPKYIVPLHYDLLLYPNIGNDSFSGAVNVTVNVTRHTKCFIVHAYKLVVLKSTVYRGEDEVEVERSFLYDPHEYFVVETENEVGPGLYKISFTFRGSLVGGIVGFYKSRYTDSNNETRYLATSKFQPTYARRAFPCFDEPSFKSTFSVSLVHDPDYIALSNMPVQVTEPYSDLHLVVTRFQKSVPMVTYLACFIVCDFSYSGTTTKDGKQFRVYSTPHQVSKTEYALKFGSRVLEYFEDYFGISYPLPKQDMVAIPDFVSGAMEHWGLITFREANLLHDEPVNSPQHKQRVSAVISHEMVHMWFGNLVTMEWWDDLWLNEGFASYVEYKGVHEQHPEWDMLSQFVTEDLQPVMELDSTMSSHAIVQPVTHPDEITEIFDAISYGKGASVLRMLEFFVGKDNFRKGISQFLRKHQYNNAETSDLWKELSEACGHQGDRNISSIMSTWTEQMGFPYITVMRDVWNSSLFSAQQRRFVKNEALYRELHNDSTVTVWSIPLSYTTSKGKEGIVWIHDDQKVNFTLPLTKADWVKFNINQTGYYLVNYEQQEWERLIDLLKTNHEALSPSDRSNLLFDTFSLAEAGHIPFDVFLSMSMYLKNETHLIPWETAYASFVYLSRLLEFTDVNSLLNSYIKDITDPLYKKLGWYIASEHIDNLLQTTIIGLACHSGNQDCLNEASELFQNWTQGQEIPSTLRSLVYHYGMAEIGREEHWNYMWSRYMVEESPADRKSLLYGLAHVRIPSLIHRYLDYAMDDTKIRRQDFFSVLNYIAGNPVGRPLVWTFLRDKWQAMVERFTLNDRYLGLAVKSICSYFASDFELQEMKSFFIKYPEAGAGKRRRQQALENVQNNIKWLKSYKKDVKTWLQIEGTVPWYHYRLPPHIVPLHYDLTIHPMLNIDRFNGTVAILVRLDKPSDYFLVHAQQLNVTKTEVSSMPDGIAVSLEKTFAHEPSNFWVMKAGKKLPVGEYRLYFEFEGNLTVSLAGLYKSSYVHPELNQKRFLAATQFEATSARKAFPCFDEPTFRSTFTVHLRHDSSHFALSNTMVEEKVQLGNDLIETRFEKSLPMVTYLVCLIVCDFEYKEKITENGLRFRVYATKHNIDKADYALDIGSRIITYFEKYFDAPFPLKKLDMITIPDFDSSGMENWGLITYSEDAMLWSPQSSSIADKYFVAGLVAHELAHMWFGDLVTMKWWDDLWLNEGFASYIKVKGVQHVEPTWEVENAFASSSLYWALTRDCSVNSHPIVQNIHKSNEISEMFDSISYNKGASVLRMLETLMEEDFRDGVSAYLKKYAFGNARTEDLWAELTAASKRNLNVSSLMDTWTRQMNYPYITVKKSEGKVILQQHHYLADPETKFYYKKPSPFSYVWQVPLTYRTSENREVGFTLLNSTEEVSLPSEASWIKFNVNFTGFFLVNYEEQDWKQFMKILMEDHTIFSPSDRMNLLFDSFSLASSGLLSYDIPLNLSLYLKKETHFSPFKVAIGHLNRIKSFLKAHADTEELMTEHIRMLFKDLLRKFTWNDTGEYIERRSRMQVIDVACDNKNYECLSTAAKLLQEWIKENITLSPNLKGMVFRYGMRVSKDEETWEAMWTRFLVETDPQQKSDLMTALANVRNETLLRRYADYATNEDYVRKHEYFSVLATILNNPMGQSFITDFLFTNWTSLMKRFKNGGSVEYFAKDVFGKFNTEEGLKKVQDFYKRHPNPKRSGRQRRDTIEQIRSNLRFSQKYQPKVDAWLRKNIYMPWNELRLPLTVKPTVYDIKIHPNMSLSTFTGNVDIEINVTEATDCLVVHQNGLQIISTQLSVADDGSLVEIDELFPYEKNQFWVIRLAGEIPAGVYNLKMEFSGKIYDEEFGLGRYSYTHKDTGETRFVGLTQFEPTNARKAFPCFDEPIMKARFKLTIVHDPGDSAVSNMPEESRQARSDGLVETSFEESVPMSTYLLCYLISDFDYLETEYKGKKIRTYAPPDRVHLAEHSLNFTVEILEFFEDFYNITYALPKLDSVAVIGYAPNGMEHWGLIAYRESRFLVEETLSPQRILEDIDQVIAHELAHQWFGNLVTMKWWNDVWLNEGFSTFAHFMALVKYYPEAHEVYVKDIVSAMRRDSTMESRPIIAHASNPAEILGLFDSISYRKGAAVLKMLEYALKDDFRKGVTNYLKKFAFSNTDTKDLWNELSMASETELNISEVMDTWTMQMGFPYVEIQREEGSITATQHWFSAEKSRELVAEVMEKNPYGYLWKIPLVYKDVDTGQEQSFWLNEKNATFFTNTSKDALLKFNPEFNGYYIVKYNEDDWMRLAERLLQRHQDFKVTDRYNLLHDAIQLADTGRLLFDIPLQLSKYLIKEHHKLPWEMFFFSFRQVVVNHLYVDSDTYWLSWRYIKDLTSDLYDQYVGQESDFALLVRNMACISFNEKCVQHVGELFQKWMLGESVEFPFLLVVKITAMKLGNESIWEQMYSQLTRPDIGEDEQESLGEALGSFQDPSLINRTIEMILFDQAHSRYLAYTVYKGMLGNPVALPLLWDLTTNSWPRLRDRLGEGIIPLQCSHFKTVEYLGKMVKFLKRYPEINPEGAAECISQMQTSIEWLDKYEDNLLSWLRWNVQE